MIEDIIIRAGCKTLFIDYDYAEYLKNDPDKRVRSIEEAAEWMLNNL